MYLSQHTTSSVLRRSMYLIVKDLLHSRWLIDKNLLKFSLGSRLKVDKNPLSVSLRSRLYVDLNTLALLVVEGWKMRIIYNLLGRRSENFHRSLSINHLECSLNVSWWAYDLEKSKRLNESLSRNHLEGNEGLNASWWTYYVERRW